MISKTKISNREKKKTDFELVETLRQAKKHDSWRKVAQKISAGTRNYSSLNLKDIDEQTSAGDTVIIIGKVLATGNLTKKLRVCALGFSESAREKMRLSKSEVVKLVDEIKTNPKAEGVKLLE